MKQSAILFASILIILSLGACDKENDRERSGVLISFKNTGTEKIKDFIFQNQVIGNIPPESATKYYKFDRLTQANNSVIENVSLKFAKQEIKSSIFETQNSITHYSGKFNIEINVYMWCGYGFDMRIVE